MTVRLFADECVANSTIERLLSAGFDITRAADICPSVDDEQVLATAYQDGRVLLTADKDFGELAVRFGRPTRGVVNLALGDLATAARARIAVARLTELGDRILGNLVTIEPGRVSSSTTPVTRPVSPRCTALIRAPYTMSAPAALAASTSSRSSTYRRGA